MAGTKQVHLVVVECTSKEQQEQLLAEFKVRGLKAKPRQAAANPDRGVFEYPTGSGVWWARWKEGKKLRRKRCSSRNEARRVAEQMRSAVREGRSTRHRPNPILVADHIARYMQEARGTLRDYGKAELHARRWSAYFDGFTLDQITAGEIERWKAHRLAEDKAAPATVNRALAYLKRVLNVAVRDGLLDRNPMRQVKMCLENNQRELQLSLEQFQALLHALPQQFRLHFIVAIGTGLRLTNMLEMRWERVDLERRLLTVPRTKPGKAKKVWLPQLVVDLLKDAPSRQASPWVFPRPSDPQQCETRHGGLRSAWETARAACGLPELHWHDLRHAFASSLVESGVNLSTIRDLLGHSSIRMTERYAHLASAHMHDAVERVFPEGITKSIIAAVKPGKKPAPERVKR